MMSVQKVSHTLSVFVFQMMTIVKKASTLSIQEGMNMHSVSSFHRRKFEKW